MQTVKSISGANLTSPPTPIAREDEGYHLLIDRTTGALVVTLTSGAINVGNVSVAQPDAEGAPVTANPTVIAGTDAGNLVKTIKVAADGRLLVDIDNATIVGGNILVALDSASDSVEAVQPTHDDLNGNMTIQVGDVDVSAGNPVPVSAASLPLPTGAATAANQATLIAKDFATQTTLAAVLAKIIAAPATEAKQDTLIAKDFATQTTLAAVLAKIIAAPATEAKQDTLIAKDFATQTTLASILAKIIAAPATEAKQDTGNTSLSTISTNTGPNSYAATTADATSLVAKGSAGTVIAVYGYNAKTSDQYIQLHDASALPADTAVPEFVWKVKAEDNFFMTVPVGGVAFATGIVVCNSSTRATKTIGSADCWFTVVYR
jgi:hypothetical protein